MSMEMKTWHAEMVTVEQAVALAALISARVRDLGGEATVGGSPGTDGAILMVTLPDGTPPATLIGGVRFYEVHGLQIPQVPYQGVTGGA